jgi:hypothetical protein
MSTFVEITVKPSRKRGATRHQMPVAPSSLEVFVCQRLHGIRLTRSACGKTYLKESANASSVTPCRSCRVGRSHAVGKMPLAWECGSAIEVRTISV